MKKIRLLPLFLLPLFALESCGGGESLLSVSASETGTDVPASSSSSEKALEEVLSNGNVQWDDPSETKMAKAREGDSSWIAADSLAFSIVDATGITDPKVTLSSSNENVLPLKALSTTLNPIGDSNMVDGGNVQIDLTRVSLGISYLTLGFASSTGSGAKGTIVKKIEFVPYGEVPTVHYEQTVTFDYSSVKGDLWTSFSSGKVQLYSEFPYGCDICGEQVKQAGVDADKKEVSITYNAIPGLAVYCSAFYVKDEAGHYQHLSIDQPDSNVSQKDGYTVTKDSRSQSAILTFGGGTVEGGVTVKVLNSKS